MENASKALIIAGAILLSILIISLGLIIYNQAKTTIDSVNLSEQEVQTFNAKFSSYAGQNVSTSKVNQLIQQVIATNQASLDAAETAKYVTITFPGVSGASTTISCTQSGGASYSNQDKTVKTGRTYTVEITNNSKTGLVEKIVVK